MNSDPTKDPTLSQAYRAAAQAEPSPQLDARILQAAHAALAQPARKAARWSWLTLPFATAVVAILATTVALQWRAAPIPPLVVSESSPPPALAMKPASTDKSAAPATQMAGVEQAKKQTIERHALASAPQSRKLEAPTPATDALADAQVAPAISAAGAASSAAESRAETAPARAPERLSSDFLPLSNEQSADKPTPQQLEDIRKLKREGKLDAAKQATETLRKQFPHYKLPEDLRVLIEPTAADPQTR